MICARPDSALLTAILPPTAPKIFSILFALLKPFLNGTTFSKIVFLGSSDSPHTHKALLDEIEADQLPAHYGGTLTDPDGNPLCLSLVNSPSSLPPPHSTSPADPFLLTFCCVQVNMGGTVPKSYYLSSKLTTVDKNCLKVSNGSKKQVEYQLKAPHSTLR